MTKEEDKAILEHMRHELSNQIGSKYCRRKYEAVTRAIKAIENEPCDDCISREKVKEFVNFVQSIKDNHNKQGEPINYGTICDIVIRAHRLLDLPSVTPTQEWIPCSEALPLDRHAVLAWSINNTYCAYLEDEKWYIFGSYAWELEEVTAWQPLPKPYKKEDKE